MKWVLPMVLVLAASTASAKRRDARTCALVEPGFVSVDGMIEDWRSLRYSQVGAGPDASFRFRCAYDRRHLYLALDVKDDRLIRTRRGRVDAEDHVELSLRGTGREVRFRILPGALTAKRKILAGRRKPRWRKRRR